MTKPSFTAQLRAIDDADLDPYQFRMVMHFWRVGKCFETLRTTADKCSMSLGKASEVKQWLIDNGWVELVPYRGKMAVQLCSLHEQRSPHEQECSPHEQIQQENVHDMNAYLNEPISSLNEPSLNGNNDEPEKEDAALSELLRHFTELSTYFPPSDGTPNFYTKWRGPLLAIYERAGRDLGKTKKTMTKAYEQLVKDRYRITSPRSIQTTAVNMLNGAREDKPADIETVKAWEEVKRVVTSGNGPRFSDNRILEAVSSFWPEIKAMNSSTEREVRAKFERSYANALS